MVTWRVGMRGGSRGNRCRGSGRGARKVAQVAYLWGSQVVTAGYDCEVSAHIMDTFWISAYTAQNMHNCHLWYL